MTARLRQFGVVIGLMLPACVSFVVTQAQSTAGARVNDSPAQASTLTFEVVSVKPVPAGWIPLALGGSCVFQGGVQFRCPAATLEHLISMAFRFADAAVPRSRIVDGPEWIATSQFEISARLSAAVEQARLSQHIPGLLRPLLEDRFRLKTHIERRPLPVYALVAAAKDRRPGPQLREVATSCAPVPSEMAARMPARPSQNDKVCWGGNFQSDRIHAGAITMHALAEHLTNARLTDRIVLDRTDFSGYFELELRWSPAPASAGTGPAAAPSPLLDPPSLFAAVQEQLGLTLEPRTELMDVLVIDQIEQPVPN